MSSETHLCNECVEAYNLKPPIVGTLVEVRRLYEDKWRLAFYGGEGVLGYWFSPDRTDFNPSGHIAHVHHEWREHIKPESDDHAA